MTDWHQTVYAELGDGDAHSRVRKELPDGNRAPTRRVRMAHTFCVSVLPAGRRFPDGVSFLWNISGLSCAPVHASAKG